MALQLEGNKTFFFPDTPIAYRVSVSDAEDGSLADGQIEAAQVAMSIDYISEGFDYAEVMQGQRSVDTSTRFAVAQALMGTSDCGVCHQVDVQSAGPAYTAIAEKYQSDPEAPTRLAAKVIDGGSGVWGEIMMPAHPKITPNDAATIVAYILGIKDETMASLPLNGQHDLALPENDNGRGSVVVRAAYRDRGAGTVPSQTAEHVVILKSATLGAGQADVMEGVETAISGRGAGPVSVIPKKEGYITFQGIDMTGITQIDLAAQVGSRDGSVGGTVEVRLGGVAGTLIGQAEVKALPPGDGGGFRRGSPPTPITVEETNGLQDVYLVFKNEVARDIDPLMTLSTLTFKQE